MTEIETRTKVNKVKPNTLRITIPPTIRDILELNEGDMIVWSFEVIDGSLRVYMDKED